MSQSREEYERNLSGLVRHLREAKACAEALLSLPADGYSMPGRCVPGYEEGDKPCDDWHTVRQQLPGISWVLMASLALAGDTITDHVDV